MESENFKVREFSEGKIPKWKQYATLTLGHNNVSKLALFEVINLICNGMPGALGLLLRGKLYPLFLGRVGKGVVFGRNITFRHPHKITLGDDVILDDGCTLDAKGDQGSSITLGDRVFIGRNTILYCKNGSIRLDNRANIGANCSLYAKGHLSIGQGTMVAAYCYLMNGGRYDYQLTTPLADQSDITRGPTQIGSNCWLGAKVTVFDGVTIGNNAVIGAGAVVTKTVPESAIALGLPAKVVSSLEPKPSDSSEVVASHT